MTTFPLLKLPALAINEVARRIEPSDIIQLTMISARFKRYFTQNKLFLDTLTWEMPASMSLKFSKFSIAISVEQNCPDSRPRKVNNSIMQISVNRKRNEPLTRWHLKHDACHWDLLENLTIHLLSILNVKHFDFTSEFLISSYNKLFVWKYAEKFKTIAILPWLKNPALLSQENMLHFLEVVKTDELQFNAKCEHFQYTGSVKCSKLNLGELSWVTNEFLKNMECKEVLLRGDSGANLNYNELFRHWIDGEGNEILEEFDVSFGDKTQCDPKKFLEGIELEMSILR
ncbi:hypothetical protein CRE_16027 [Caenorhabditis remanei]|uniref:F-box domain-containing protein n=1 Tax=Caenorhabditis remanei TaxID=31234 RepID=E3MBF1_CAERE|nr:hypothetical protein CRE_16027 [Caenorhabditis remanei]